MKIRLVVQCQYLLENILSYFVHSCIIYQFNYLNGVLETGFEADPLEG